MRFLRETRAVAQRRADSRKTKAATIAPIHSMPEPSIRGLSGRFRTWNAGGGGGRVPRARGVGGRSRRLPATMSSRSVAAGVLEALSPEDDALLAALETARLSRLARISQIEAGKPLKTIPAGLIDARHLAAAVLALTVESLLEAP